MDKAKLKETLIAIEHQYIEQAEIDYEAYLTESQLEDSGVIDDDDQSHQRQSAEITDELDQHIHEHEEHLRLLEEINFSPAETVRPGAVVKANGRYMVVAVPKPKFKFDGKQFIGISTEAPIYKAIEGKKAGDTCQFNNINFEIQEVH